MLPVSKFVAYVEDIRRDYQLRINQSDVSYQHESIIKMTVHLLEIIASLSLYRFIEIHCFNVFSKSLTNRDNDGDSTKLEMLNDPKGYQWSKRVLHVHFLKSVFLIIIDTF